jgi:hypothetical protein
MPSSHQQEIRWSSTQEIARVRPQEIVHSARGKWLAVLVIERHLSEIGRIFRRDHTTLVHALECREREVRRVALKSAPAMACHIAEVDAYRRSISVNYRNFSAIEPITACSRSTSTI